MDSSTPGNGSPSKPAKLTEMVAAQKARIPGQLNGEITEGAITFQTSHGITVRGTLHKLARNQVVFEAYSPEALVQMSEVLSNFTVLLDDRAVYSGKAVVSNIIHTGLCAMCEAQLDDGWSEGSICVPTLESEEIKAHFGTFLQQWGRAYKILPEYKVVIADLHSFLVDLKRWLEQVELTIRSSPAGSRNTLEREIIQGLSPRTSAAIGELFDRFENVARTVEPEFVPLHQAFGRRHLHPLILSAPFVYRTLQKPLGHAGDYEMVNMMLRDPYEGASLFAKAFNACALNRPPIVAHRNRLRYLGDKLLDETLRNLRRGRNLKVLNIGCGPAHEVQTFLREQSCSDRADFTLIDFDEEAVEHVSRVMEQCKSQYGRTTACHVSRTSAQQLLKKSAKPTVGGPQEKYNFIYSAGLFDYFPDPICRSLMSYFYNLLEPGGLLLVTNVDTHSSQLEMEYFLEWHLIYRDTQTMKKLVPSSVAPHEVSLFREPAGINTFLEIRKAEGEQKPSI